MEVLKALGFSKLGVRLAIIAALPAPSDATSAASAHNGDPDEMISHCPGSRWRVVHNLLVLCVPSFEEDTSSPMTRSINMDGQSTMSEGSVLIGELYFRGWLKLSTVHHPGGGWVKRYHEPLGELVRAEGDVLVPPSIDAATVVEEMTSADALGEAERRELRQMLLPTVSPGADLAAGLDGSRWMLLQPTLGLCNRLRAVVSAVNLCSRTRRVLLLQWHPSDACGAHFLDLFNPPTGRVALWPLAAPPPRQSAFVDASGDVFSSAMALLSEGTASMPPPPHVDVPGAVHGRAAPGPVPARHATATVRAVLDTLTSARCVSLSTCADFFPTVGMVGGANSIRPATDAAWHIRSEALRATFRPSPAVLAQLPSALAAEAAFVATDVVGVHVRRTDNASAKAHSPLAGFVCAMEAVLDESPATHFFLATDDADGTTAAELRAAFGDRRILMPSTPVSRPAEARRTPAGMQKGLVDLLALSRCRQIIGSFYSSFSVWAAVWHRRPLQIVEQ